MGVDIVVFYAIAFIVVSLISIIILLMHLRNSCKGSVPGIIDFRTREELERDQATRNATTFQSQSQGSQHQVFLIPDISSSPPPYQTYDEHSVPVVYVIPLDELDHLTPPSYDQATCGIDYYSLTIK